MMPKQGMTREPMETAKALFRERSLAVSPRETEFRERLGRGPVEVGASEPCLLSLPGSGPQALYLGATPDGTAEDSVVAGDD